MAPATRSRTRRRLGAGGAPPPVVTSGSRAFTRRVHVRIRCVDVRAVRATIRRGRAGSNDNPQRRAAVHGPAAAWPPRALPARTWTWPDWRTDVTGRTRQIVRNELPK